jgi:hypothetical protein
MSGHAAINADRARDWFGDGLYRGHDGQRTEPCCRSPPMRALHLETSCLDRPVARVIAATRGVCTRYPGRARLRQVRQLPHLRILLLIGLMSETKGRSLFRYCVR